MKKACKKCRRLVTGDKCPVCNAKTTKSWKGRVYIVTPEKSTIAEKLKLTEAGEYTIRI
jgi:RNA polymerase subunit RPABC4/transcription elongation factor Spt4